MNKIILNTFVCMNVHECYFFEILLIHLVHNQIPNTYRGLTWNISKWKNPYYVHSYICDDVHYQFMGKFSNTFHLKIVNVKLLYGIITSYGKIWGEHNWMK